MHSSPHFTFYIFYILFNLPKKKEKVLVVEEDVLFLSRINCPCRRNSHLLLKKLLMAINLQAQSYFLHAHTKYWLKSKQNKFLKIANTARAHRIHRCEDTLLLSTPPTRSFQISQGAGKAQAVSGLPKHFPNNSSHTAFIFTTTASACEPLN